MNTLMIEELNKEKERKAIYCQIMDCLFNADLMANEVGRKLRREHLIKDLI